MGPRDINHGANLRLLGMLSATREGRSATPVA
jgi:hypothetical protein